ncbi:ABC transporter permease [Solitalea koreensis]|uniref:Peptide/nickel transport system permease protein n=1 Tax=Solitalea koreensis TaxID=543615 RepID=A0A521CIZ1_9SPHI|nr:ABC transporter permease [Solitalea koreensis]SMO59345.1 peptide/nickel transport system permease protein [Solitalea koreensis]
MISYILNKVFYGLLVLFGIVVTVFFLFNVLPGDPARMTQGQRSDVQSLEAVRKELGLDKPLSVQFVLFVNDISPIGIHEADSALQAKYHFSKLFPVGTNKVLALKWPYLRRSYQTKRDVADILAETIPNTLVLAVTAMIFATVIGITLGVISAIKKDTWIDKGSIAFSIIGISAPSFFAGILIAWLFGFVLSRYTGLNMSGSLHNYDPFKGEVLTMKNLILPMITLGLRPLAIIVQLTRSSMLEVLSQDYIRTARAKGLSNYSVVWKHALRNALNPVVTAVSGWFASLMAGSFFVEYIFGYNGLGKATVDALGLSDFPVVMGSILFCGFIFVLTNILVDVLYGVLDPRVRVR